MKYTFVILHYYTIDDTIELVNSIQEKIKEEYNIVIVDNCSKNNTGKELEQKYQNSSNIKVLLLDENLGFARGNNAGIDYAINTLKSDFVIVLNNDTIITQNDFLKNIAKDYEESNFAVIGPKIIDLNGIYTSNPMSLKSREYQEVKKSVFKLYIRYILAFLNLEWVIDKVKNKNVESNNLSINYDQRYENIILQGACLIFSPKFFEYYKGFDNGTFLYMEEEILFAMLKKKNLKSVYNPEIEIIHKEDSSTNATIKSTRKKKLMIYKNHIKSTKVLLKVLNDN